MTFSPKIITCLKSGYSRKTFVDDLLAGITVGVVAIPLALAFAIASGVEPERGLYTAIVAGFLISLLGGSRVQIGGPTGAFVVIIYAIVEKHGYDGLAIATIMAGLLLILMGVFKLGNFIKFIPFPVITGFTAGIAVIIVTSQVKDFLGLNIQKLPADFIDKVLIYAANIKSVNYHAAALATISAVIIFILRRVSNRIPSAILVIVVGGLIVHYLKLPVETVGQKFGEMQGTLPAPSLPGFTWEKIVAVIPASLTIALLGAIESLLSAKVGDSMTGYRHRPNTELIAQGIANVFSIIFGGISATGAIARTATNIKSGAKTPVAGIIHALMLLLVLLFLAPLAYHIPMASLAAVLVVVAWYMSESHNFLYIFRSSAGDVAVLLATFILTITVDLTVAVEVGIIMSALLFIKKISDVTDIKKQKPIRKQKTLLDARTANYVEIYELSGPIFFGVSDKLVELAGNIQNRTRVVILRLGKVSSIDISGIRALEFFITKCHKSKVQVIFSEASNDMLKTLKRMGLSVKPSGKYKSADIDSAIKQAKNLLA